MFSTKKTRSWRSTKTVNQAERMAPELLAICTKDAVKLGIEMERYVGLGKRVIDQTQRRVFAEEQVPATEKVVSIFEDHADVIVKDRRETYYGHKVFLTTGTSGLLSWHLPAYDLIDLVHVLDFAVPNEATIDTVREYPNMKSCESTVLNLDPSP